ncbi:MAG: hypothetical protein U9Q62_01650 [Campylobacterota bacterium]|nr:hypothetical protein [Campylobacterota bacterium]
MKTFQMVRDSYPEYRDHILEQIENKVYSYRRYDVPFTSLLIYSNDPIDLNVCTAHIRQSDNIYMLEKNLMLVVYDVISQENSYKAAQNFMHQYQNHHNLRQDLYVAIAPAEEENTAIDMASRLFIIMEYALKEGCKNSVVDMAQMRGKE